VNLESPSLTRLMLERLTGHHLRFGGGGGGGGHNDDDTTTISMGLTRLLQQVDVDLFLALEHDITAVCQVCYEWIITWFTQDILDPTLISQLLDIFVISHPAMPVYMAVAMLNTHRSI
jgi:hypothetical protein